MRDFPHDCGMVDTYERLVLYHYCVLSSNVLTYSVVASSVAASSVVASLDGRIV